MNSFKLSHRFCSFLVLPLYPFHTKSYQFTGWYAGTDWAYCTDKEAIWNLKLVANFHWIMYILTFTFWFGFKLNHRCFSPSTLPFPYSASCHKVMTKVNKQVASFYFLLGELPNKKWPRHYVISFPFFNVKLKIDSKKSLWTSNFLIYKIMDYF